MVRLFCLQVLGYIHCSSNPKWGCNIHGVWPRENTEEPPRLSWGPFFFHRATLNLEQLKFILLRSTIGIQFLSGMGTLCSRLLHVAVSFYCGLKKVRFNSNFSDVASYALSARQVLADMLLQYCTVCTL